MSRDMRAEWTHQVAKRIQNCESSCVGKEVNWMHYYDSYVTYTQCINVFVLSSFYFFFLVPSTNILQYIYYLDKIITRVVFRYNEELREKTVMWGMIEPLERPPKGAFQLSFFDFCLFCLLNRLFDDFLPCLHPFIPQFYLIITYHIILFHPPYNWFLLVLLCASSHHFNLLFEFFWSLPLLLYLSFPPNQCGCHIWNIYEN